MNHPETRIDIFASDEHRIGLKPVIRRVWAPVGERPTALGHHRFDWLYVTAFVAPSSGETFWYIANGVSKPLFEALLALFARDTGAGKDRIILLLIDNAGWHTQQGLSVPDGIELIYLPPYTPELQPAETLWVHVDEPIANTYLQTIEELDRTIAAQCRKLSADQDRIKSQTCFNWWPQTPNPN